MGKIDFTIHKLKKDPSFRRLVRGIASTEEIEIWNNWIESSDKNRQIAKLAISEMVGFEFRISNAPNIQKEWRQLQKKTVGNGVQNYHLHNAQDKTKNRLKWVFRSVAVIILIVIVGTGVYLHYENDSFVPQLEQLTSETKIMTEEGEQKTLNFSNGSKVILNSFSTLTYRLGSYSGSTIEITLDGEAWFDAGPGGDSDEPVFAVNTPDGIITDIGTKFLVKVENGHSAIVLQEGLVEIEPLDLSNSGMQEKKFQVQEGEMVEFRRAEIITRRYVNPTYYSSWATGMLKLEETDIEEFSEYIEQQFDVEVKLKDSRLKNMQLNGTVYFRSLDELMRSVSEVIGLTTYRPVRKDTVFLGD